MNEHQIALLFEKISLLEKSIEKLTSEVDILKMEIQEIYKTFASL
jgi:regulator of replication initiation timing